MGNRPQRTGPNPPRQSGREAMREALEASLAEAPLPNGWEEAVTPKGVTYYIDHLNKKTTFNDPRLAKAKIKSSKDKKSTNVKPPKYKVDFYSKVQNLYARIHQVQHDEGHIEIICNRNTLFEDSYDFISGLDTFTLTRRLFIKFEGEEGLDYGGMSREWFVSLSEEFTKPERHLFTKSPNGHYYTINRNSHLNPHHLELFYFVGQVIGMAAYHSRVFQTHFTPTIYKAILGRTPDISDIQYIDKDIHKNLVSLSTTTDVTDWDLDFTLTDTDLKGKPVVVELKKGGADIEVTNENKSEYIKLAVEYLVGSTTKQTEAMKTGLHPFVPIELLQEFEPEEIEQVISGTTGINLEDLKANTTYKTFTESSPTVKYFWEIVGSMTSDQLKQLLLFVTGSTKVPIGGFAHLLGSNGPEKFLIQQKETPGLPTAHSCFNRLELCVYKSMEVLKRDLLLAISETKGFGLE